MSVLSNSNAIPSGSAGYTMTNSVRLRQSASASFSRTPSSAGDRKTWTWSAWIKRGELTSTYPTFFDAYAPSGNVYHLFRFYGDYMYIVMDNTYTVRTNAVFRDPASWYHIVVTNDTTQATASNRLKIWVNGVQQSLTFTSGTYPAQNFQGNINGGYQHSFGKYIWSNTYFFDGYVADAYLIDGQALTPSEFGEYGEETGSWQAKKYTGTYGSNGYYLDMSTSGSTITDQSGNGNNWTATNMNLTTSTATTYDKMTDVPTLTDEDTGNFCTLNFLTKWSNVTLANGNLEVTNVSSGGGNGGVAGTHIMTSGKWYWEFTNNHPYSAVGIALADEEFPTKAFFPDQWVYYGNGNKYANSSSASSYGASFGSGDVIGIAFDADAGTLVMYKNNTSQGTLATGLTAVHGYVPFFGSADGATGGKFNFGQRPFKYTPPTGYKKLNTFNLPDSSIKDGSQYMNTMLYTGNGTSQSITGVGFSPDLVWTKSRNSSVNANHAVSDTVRGVNSNLFINLTNAGTFPINGTTSFDSDGWQIGSNLHYNRSGDSYVSWVWRGSDSTAVSNTDGTRTSTVSANTTSGFSIVKFNSGSSSFTVGHGLGTTPAMLIMKDYTSTTNWAIWHKGLSNLAQNWLQFDTGGENGNSTAFNNTAPSASVVSLSNSYLFNSNQDCIMYAFAEVEGFSKFGTYVANSSTDGPFVYTGFRPAFVMVKARNMNQEWVITDSARRTYNPSDKALFPNNSNAESISNAVDYLSNGFKIRTAGDGTNYSSGQVYIYVAFAENPFKNSPAR